jgi:hypothetical protein
MVWAVIAILWGLSAGLAWLAWQMWLLRRAFIATVVSVDGWNRACENGLKNAPEAILMARRGAQGARGQVRLLAQQLVKVYGILKTVRGILQLLQPRTRGNGKR